MMRISALMTLAVILMVVSLLLEFVPMEIFVLMILVMKALENVILSQETVMIPMLAQLILV
jgi:hypothetical protein